MVFSSAVTNGGAGIGGICDGVCIINAGASNVLGIQRLGISDITSNVFAGVPNMLLAGGATTFDLGVVTFQAVGPIESITLVTVDPFFGSPMNGGEALFALVVVPEPGIGALLGVALGVLALRRRGVQRSG